MLHLQFQAERDMNVIMRNDSLWFLKNWKDHSKCEEAWRII